jgi:predicted nuclease of predicted toxin-antitoxin system
MKLLFDQNISFRIEKKISHIFPGSLHVSSCGLSNCEDQEIWEYALKYHFAIVTFDSDFYDISVINGHPPKILWLRTGNLPTNEIVPLLKSKKKIIQEFLTNRDYQNILCLEIDN